MVHSAAWLAAGLVAQPGSLSNPALACSPAGIHQALPAGTKAVFDMVGQVLAECTAPGCSVRVPPAQLCIQQQPGSTRRQADHSPAGPPAGAAEVGGCLQFVHYQVPACLTIPTCGDGLCNPFEGQQEDLLSCPYDCYCGDGVCDASERAGSLAIRCERDCGGAALPPPPRPAAGGGQPQGVVAVGGGGSVLPVPLAGGGR
jgi:hypothetical protein